MPSTGIIEAQGRIASLLEVGTGFHPEMTGRENIYMNGSIMGMSKSEITRKLDEIIDFSGVERYIDTPVKRYSSGMTVRLGFAIAAHLEPEILVVDEVLAVGDAEFQKKAIGKMQDVSKGDGRTVLYVSHNLSSVSNLCKTGILLENGQISSTGAIDKVIDKYIGARKNNAIKKEHGVIRELNISQVGNKIQIYCKYSSKNELAIPCFGFVISDHYENKIFGTNPQYNVPDKPLKPSKKGEILVTINTPQLINGLYMLSVWMGDGKVNYEELENIIQFEVINMVKFDKDNIASGPVFCKADFDFTYF